MNSSITIMAPSPVHPLDRQGVLRISGLSNYFISAEREMKIGNWNVRTVNQDGKIEELVVAFEKYGLDMCALTETTIHCRSAEALFFVHNILLNSRIRMIS